MENIEPFVPQDWKFMEMDSAEIADKGYVEEMIWNIRQAGFRVFQTGAGKIRVGKKHSPIQAKNLIADHSFRLGIAPSLIYDGFTNIKFENSKPEKSSDTEFEFLSVIGILPR